MKILTIILVSLLSLTFTTQAMANSPLNNGLNSSETVEIAKKKKGCDAKKTKKAKQRCKKLRKSGKYKAGQTCAISKEMQKEYAKYGLTCIDLTTDPIL